MQGRGIPYVRGGQKDPVKPVEEVTVISWPAGQAPEVDRRTHGEDQGKMLSCGKVQGLDRNSGTWQSLL